MVVEPVHSFSIPGRIAFCLLDVMFLRVEEHLIFLLHAASHIYLYRPHRNIQLTVYSS